MKKCQKRYNMGPLISFHNLPCAESQASPVSCTCMYDTATAEPVTKMRSASPQILHDDTNNNSGNTSLMQLLCNLTWPAAALDSALEHAHRIQANQFKWPLKVSPNACEQQQQKKNQTLSSAGSSGSRSPLQREQFMAMHTLKYPTGEGVVCSLGDSCLVHGLTVGQSVGRPLSPQSESGYSGLSSFRKSCPGSKPALPAATANKEPGNTAVKNCFLCVCVCKRNK